jgi:hypothetical protein
MGNDLEGEPIIFVRKNSQSEVAKSTKIWAAAVNRPGKAEAD